MNNFSIILVAYSVDCIEKISLREFIVNKEELEEIYRKKSNYG